MLSSPLATSEDVLNVVTNVRNPSKFTGDIGKTGGIDVRHFEGGLLEVLDKLGRVLSIELSRANTFYICYWQCPNRGFAQVY